VIYPYPPNLDGEKYASSIGAKYILGRGEAARTGYPTLSPVTFNEEPGAILAGLGGRKSPEAEVCAGAYTCSVNRLKDLIWDSGSGRV
jgi:hypothetical protein